MADTTKLPSTIKLYSTDDLSKLFYNLYAQGIELIDGGGNAFLLGRRAKSGRSQL